ncbi:MAG: tetratricopeptide repeat protein, partial [Spirochaetaceae bacterium]|nr:tetratricopeptide repeat protein [Spirochaetaceae bacterium]
MIFAQSVFGTSGAKKPSALEWYNRGKDEQDVQNWYTAIELYQEAVRANPSYGQAWLSLAECTYALGEYDLAISYADTAAEYLKNTTAIDNLKGFALIGLARLDEARAVFDKVLTRYPNDTDARFGLAELDIFIGKISGAESYYLDALKRQPESRKALLSLALVSYELGKTKAAKEYINQALKYHSDNPEVHYFAAYILAREGSWIEAEGRVRAAIQLKPGYDEAYSLLASILYSTMRYQSVVDICEYRISRDRKSTSAWYLKGLALTRLNRIEEAIATYQSGLEIDPEDEIMRTAMEQLVCSYLDIEDSRRARWAQWHSKKAEEFSQKYQSLQARYEYKRALVLNPSSAASRIAFSEILLRDG